MSPCDEECRICASSFVGGEGEKLVGTKLLCEESGCSRRFSLLCLLRSSGIDFPIRWCTESSYSVSPESFHSLEALLFMNIRCARCAEMTKPISVDQADQAKGTDSFHLRAASRVSAGDPPSTESSSKLDLLASNLCEIKKVVTVNSVTLSRMARQSLYRSVKKSPQAPVTPKAHPSEPRQTSQQKNSVYFCRLMKSDNHEDVLEAINCSNVEVETQQREVDSERTGG